MASHHELLVRYEASLVVHRIKILQTVLAVELRSFVKSCHTIKDLAIKASKEEKEKITVLASKHRVAEIPLVKEFYGCVRYMATQEGSCEDLLRRLDAIFQGVTDNATTYITCSTIHRSKGR